jgi:hypothetical protein
MKESLYNQLGNDIYTCNNIISSISSFEHKVEAIRKYIFSKYLRKYVRGNAGITDLLLGRGGNCEAQTKLVIHFFLSCRLNFPAFLKLGVQQFTDHVQPVIYNKQTKEVMEIISGKRIAKILAPIYEPPILLHAFLLGQGIAPPLNINELLIVDFYGENKKSKNKYGSNTDLAFQGGKGVYNDGEIPAETNLDYSPMNSNGDKAKDILNIIIKKISSFFGNMTK